MTKGKNLVGENNEILRASLPSNEEIDIRRVKPGKKRYNFFVKKTNKIRKGWKHQNILMRDQSKDMND